MSLDLGNKFNVFSPTHDSKLVTRLQHVFHAVRAAGRPADNNRMWHISGDCQRFGNEWYLFVCLLTASRTGTCRPISMGSWPWRRSKIWIRALPSAEIQGQMPTKWQITCSSWPACNCPWWSHSWCPLQANQQRKWILRRGVGRKKKCGQSRGDFAQCRRMQTTQRIQLRIGSRLAKHFVQWFAQRGPTLFALTETTCPPMGEICKPKDEPNDYCGRWI